MIRNSYIKYELVKPGRWADVDRSLFGYFFLSGQKKLKDR